MFFDEVPNALFFADDITKNDGFEFRKAIRNHDIDTIVLSSPGGALWEGLTIAGMIFDKKLTTYVPRNTSCASACAFMFFAGNKRQVAGSLGVHQFYTDSEASAKITNVETGSQFTVSEIIGYLNEFNTPPFVFEKMFAQKEMYYFTDNEIKKLNSPENDEATLANFIRIDNHLANIRVAIEKLKIDTVETQKTEIAETKLEVETPSLPIKKLPPKVKQSTSIIKAEVQKELNRLGCEAGTVDGIIGKKSQLALFRFTKKTDYNFDSKLFSSKDFLTAIQNISSFECPEITPIKLGSFYKLDWKCSGEGNGWSTFFKPKKINSRKYDFISSDKFGRGSNNNSLSSLLIDFEDHLTVEIKSSKVELWTGKYSEAEKKIYLTATPKNKYDTCKLVGSTATPETYNPIDEVRSKTLAGKILCLGAWGLMLGTTGTGAACIPW